MNQKSLKPKNPEQKSVRGSCYLEGRDQITYLPDRNKTPEVAFGLKKIQATDNT